MCWASRPISPLHRCLLERQPVDSFVGYMAGSGMTYEKPIIENRREIVGQLSGSVSGGGHFPGKHGSWSWSGSWSGHGGGGGPKWPRWPWR